MAIRNYIGPALIEQWDADTGLYTRYNEMGAIRLQRPLTDRELARVQRHDRDVAEAQAVDQAHQTVDGMQAAAAAFAQQIQADIATVQAGWGLLDADTQTEIMLRILGGFTHVMNGLSAHAAVTGAIDPLATEEDA